MNLAKFALALLAAIVLSACSSEPAPDYTNADTTELDKKIAHQWLECWEENRAKYSAEYSMETCRRN